jgi:hypothetical protein
MSRRTEYRNEVKTRVDDQTYEGLRAFMALNGIDHDSVGVARALRLFLFGSVGTLPANLLDRSAALARFGTEVAA